ncbi:metaxin-2 [Plakobranchus ocellatus]|uniref:Metaxin-2 n=1 Tax=Plakobranchus ocellatus TaxID=259542 RepID=A0AAV4AQ28_9GAST|nr:metaxin-2 [Plakobranchus ocellatus]
MTALLNFMEGSGNPKMPASQPWPEDVILYQQYQVEQITLPDYSQCLAVEAFLRMSGLLFRVEQRTNAADMSPTGKVPFIQVGSQLIAEFEPVAAFVASKGFGLSKDLPEESVAEMRAYISMLDNILSNAEHYVAWLVPEVVAEVTKPRYGCAYPWPLNWLLPWLRQREVRNFLTVKDWASKSLEEVVAEVKTCFRALSEKLGKNKYFLGTSPTELDAVVFGHLYTLQMTKLPGSPFCAVTKEYENLINFTKRIESTFFF